MALILDVGSTIELAAQDSAISGSAPANLLAIVDMGSTIQLISQPSGILAYVGRNNEDIGNPAELAATGASVSSVIVLTRNGTGVLVSGSFLPTAVQVTGAGSVYVRHLVAAALQSGIAEVDTELRQKWQRLPAGSKTWLKAAEESDTWTPIAKGNKNWN